MNRTSVPTNKSGVTTSVYDEAEAALMRERHKILARLRQLETLEIARSLPLLYQGAPSNAWGRVV